MESSTNASDVPPNDVPRFVESHRAHETTLSISKNSPRINLRVSETNRMRKNRNDLLNFQKVTGEPNGQTGFFTNVQMDIEICAYVHI